MAEKIYEREVSITTTGGAGSATGTATIEECNGFLLDVFLNWHASAPSSSVVKITDKDGVELLDAPAGNTDIRYAPRKDICSDHGVATGLYDMHPLNGDLTVTVTLSNALTACLVAKIRYLATHKLTGTGDQHGYS
jgi:hypothetical protein